MSRREEEGGRSSPVLLWGALIFVVCGAALRSPVKVGVPAGVIAALWFVVIPLARWHVRRTREHAAYERARERAEREEAGAGAYDRTSRGPRSPARRHPAPLAYDHDFDPNEDGEDQWEEDPREASPWVKRLVLGVLVVISLGVLWWLNPWLLILPGAALLVRILKPALGRPPAASGEPTGPVNLDKLSAWAGSIEKGWDKAATAAGLTGGEGGGAPIELADKARPNGAGGVVLHLSLAGTLLLPQHVRGAATMLQRHLRAGYVVVAEPAGGVFGGVDQVDVHLHPGFPLVGHRVPWRGMEPRPWSEPGMVPIGLTATGETAQFPYRHSWLIVGLPDAGKTYVQLAGAAGLAQCGVPTVLYVLDNKGDRGARELEQLRPVSEMYGRTPLDAMLMLSRVKAELDHRLNTWPAGEREEATYREPLIVLIVTELLNLISPRVSVPTDAEVAEAGVSWEQISLGRWSSRPSHKDWLSLTHAWLGAITQQGRGVLVALWGATQTPVLEDLGRWRDYMTIRTALRLLAANNVNAALGERAEELGAQPVTIPPGRVGAGIGWLRDSTGVPDLFRSAYVPYDDVGRAIVEPFAEIRKIIAQYQTAA